MRVFFVLLVALAGCDDTEFPNNLGEGGGDVEGEGFDAVSQLVTTSCLNGCHEAAVALAGLDLETDLCAAIVNAASGACGGTLVVPGDADASLLYQKVADLQDCGGVMPPSGALSAASISIFEGWINDGAVCGDGDPAPTDTGEENDSNSGGW